MNTKQFISRALALALVFAGPVAGAQEGEIEADLPRSMASPLRVMPVAGASSFATADRVELGNFDEGLSAGVLADIGAGFWTFETGVLTLQSNVDRAGSSAAIDVDTWGIPLLAKMNFSGKPHETVFLKAGAMPFTAGGEVNDFDIMGVGGIGAHIPLGRNSSLLFDATYNRLFTTGGDLTSYQGISLLSGLSFNI